MIPISYNIRNLVVRWKTTLLTAIGFTLVVALLVVMLAFVQGLNALSEKTGPPGNVIILRDGATDELFSDLADDANLAKLWTNHPEIVKENGKPLVSLEVYSIATQELPPEKEGGRPGYRFLQVRGVEDCAMSGRVHGLQLKAGRWFRPTGNEVVMGEGIAHMLGLSVGDTFYPREKPETAGSPAQSDASPSRKDVLRWVVVGIMDSRGSPFDSEIWAKRVDVGQYFGKDNEERGQRFFTSIVVRTHDAATAEAFAKDLQNRVEEIRINAMPERTYYEEMSKSNMTFLAAAIFIAVVMAIGGMFGLMNTMFAAVSQRIKDIGVLRVLGYERWQVLVSFLLESLLLAALGGALGMLAGFSVNGIEQTGFLSAGQGGGKTVVFTMTVDGFVIGSAIAFTLLMGVLGGVLPAWTAMRLRPLEALR